MSLVKEPDKQPILPLSFVLPGTFLILGIEVMNLTGILSDTPGLRLSMTLLMLILPWAALLLARMKGDALGFRRARFSLDLGWGMVAGGIWRVGSVLLNLWTSQLEGLGFTSVELVTAVLWVPFVEETFFRAYIGRSISRSWGALPGILIQAILFTFMPGHISQSLSAVSGIFVFGVLAGWIMHMRDSIWAPWGAHAFANLLPLLVLAVY